MSADKNSFYFNPRPREEGDCSDNANYRLLQYFNPRPREEGDDSIHCDLAPEDVFQSTPS